MLQPSILDGAAACTCRWQRNSGRGKVTNKCTYYSQEVNRTQKKKKRALAWYYNHSGKHIQSRSSNLPRLQRLYQSVFVDNGTARGVDAKTLSFICANSLRLSISVVASRGQFDGYDARHEQEFLQRRTVCRIVLHLQFGGEPRAVMMFDFEDKYSIFPCHMLDLPTRAPKSSSSNGL